jgi:hypothetical protein
MFAHRFIGGSDALDRDLTHSRPRVLKILTIDDKLPLPLGIFSSPAHIGEDISKIVNLGPNWLAYFKRMAETGVGVVQ